MDFRRENLVFLKSALICTCLTQKYCFYPVGIYMFKVNNRNTKIRCEICSKLTIKIPKRRHWRRSVVFIVNFKKVYADWVLMI